MVQFARVQNRVRRAAIALPGQALPLLAVARFHHGTRLTLGNSACYEPLGADDEKPTRAPCADDIVSPLPCPAANRVLRVGQRPCDIIRHLATILKTNAVAPPLREYAGD